MQRYEILWFIDIEADTPEEAASIALGIQRDPESVATVFTVQSETASICIDAATGEILPSDLPGYWSAKKG